ncbi:MAG: bifunctional diaminohydroxyphosphoribosylaminopyrimidine deaminase/5-amino-6-(5-phosphoribosylamino)uracil reductase RibD [Opitutaceae bacterium]
MSEAAQSDFQFMQRAIELARRAWGQTHPNPMVGAVIVEDGEIVGEGWHRSSGQPHAEIEALKALGRAPSADAKIYVTLEPCSTCGRTGACTDAIIESGIKHVVIGAEDPNPDHAGQGVDILKAAGVEVITGVLADDCLDLNLIFNHWIVNRSPLIAAKMALTLDGKFAAASGQSKWVTGEAARADVMRWRRYFPAIAVGANTVLSDDPSLTSRIDGEVWCPIRFVFDRSLKTAKGETLPQLYSDTNKDRTIIICSPSAHTDERNRLNAAGIKIWELPETAAGHLDFTAFRNRCAEAEIFGVYIECGPSLATSLIEEQLADYLFSYQAPKFMSDLRSRGIGTDRNTDSMKQAIKLSKVRHSICGEDVLTRGFL